MLVLLGQRLFGWKKTADLTARDVEGYLQDFVEGRGGDWDWDDFTSIPVTDPTLEQVRREAAAVNLPLDEGGRALARTSGACAGNVASEGPHWVEPRRSS